MTKKNDRPGLNLSGGPFNLLCFTVQCVQNSNSFDVVLYLFCSVIVATCEAFLTTASRETCKKIAVILFFLLPRIIFFIVSFKQKSTIYKYMPKTETVLRAYIL